MVNDYPDILSDAIGLGPIDWCSPLRSDNCAEYRDDAFLARLGVTELQHPLSRFWPKLGPQWDALGRAQSGPYILVEAKGNLPELLTSPSGAGTDSAKVIEAALDETARALGASPGTDWSKRFYQYANRLAHAYFLNERNHRPTQLVFLYFIGDAEVEGPESRREWEAAITVLHEALGIRGRVPKYVSDAFIDIRGSVPLVA
jgi:hypothetical protein